MSRKTIPQISRDSILFFSGLIGVGYETFGENAERPTLLILFGAMMGLPVFLNADEARKQNPPVDPPVPAEAKPSSRGNDDV